MESASVGDDVHGAGRVNGDDGAGCGNGLGNGTGNSRDLGDGLGNGAGFGVRVGAGLSKELFGTGSIGVRVQLEDAAVGSHTSS